MAGSKLIWSDVTTDKRLGLLSDRAERLFYRLLTVTDDFGRFHAEPEIVAGSCWPRSGYGMPETASALDELERAGLIRFYSVDADRFLWFPNHDKHQRFRKDRPRKARFPEPRTPVVDAIGCQLTTIDGQVATIDGQVSPSPTPTPTPSPLFHGSQVTTVDRQPSTNDRQRMAAGFDAWDAFVVPALRGGRNKKSELPEPVKTVLATIGGLSALCTTPEDRIEYQRVRFARAFALHTNTNPAEAR